MIGAILLGALTGADRTAWGQSFLALPVVAALASGWWAGADPLATSWYALALTTLGWRALLPVGEARARDLALAAVLGPAVAGPAATPAQWGAVLVLGLLAAELGGLAITATREFTRRALPDPANTPAGALPGPGGIEARQWGFAGLHALRGGLGVALLLPAGSAFLELRPFGATAGPDPLLWFWGLAPALGLAHLVRSSWAGAR